MTCKICEKREKDMTVLYATIRDLRKRIKKRDLYISRLKFKDQNRRIADHENE